MQYLKTWIILKVLTDFVEILFANAIILRTKCRKLVLFEGINKFSYLLGSFRSCNQTAVKCLTQKRYGGRSCGQLESSCSNCWAKSAIISPNRCFYLYNVSNYRFYSTNVTIHIAKFGAIWRDTFSFLRDSVLPTCLHVHQFITLQYQPKL